MRKLLVIITISILFSLTTSAQVDGTAAPNKYGSVNATDSTMIQTVSTLISALSAFGTLAALVFLNRTVSVAKNQILAQEKIAKEGLVNQWEILRKGLDNERELLRLSTNARIINDLHFLLLENPKFLKFHDTSEEQIISCGLDVKQFVYALNSILASEFYYDNYTSPDDILEDFSLYRMKFLYHNEIECAWNNIIKKNWTMNKDFVAAIDRFYSNPTYYLNRRK